MSQPPASDADSVKLAKDVAQKEFGMDLSDEEAHFLAWKAREAWQEETLPFSTMSDIAMIDEYHRALNDQIRKVMDASMARLHFDLCRKECIERGLREKKGRRWAWTDKANAAYSRYARSTEEKVAVSRTRSADDAGSGPHLTEAQQPGE